MNRTVLSAIFTLLCILADAQPMPPKEIRAVWLATIGGIDWPRTYATSPQTIQKQKQELCTILDRLKAININTVLLQTRVRGTVIYPSQYEPWDGCMSGRPGMSPDYDPLAFAIDECHKRGLEIHAWVVTIPIGKWNNLGCRKLRQRYPKSIIKIGDEGYLHPEHSITADYLSDICCEITQKYNIDGIHLDYIRYPETWKFKTSKQQGREHITNIVRKIRNCIKSIRPSIKLSCSPLGKHDDLARYSSRGWNARQTVCQDAQAWLADRLMDQLYPMIYFKENNFYPFAIDWAEHSQPGQVAAGLGIYFLDPKEGNWKISEVKRQLNVCRQLGLGQCFFRARFLLDNVQGLYDYLRIFNFAGNGELSTLGIMPTPSIPYPTLPNSTDSLFPRQPGSPGTIAPTPQWITAANSLPLPPRPSTQDADMLLITSLAGNAIRTLPWRGRQADISSLPAGMYYLNSLNCHGISHRLAMLKIER